MSICLYLLIGTLFTSLSGEASKCDDRAIIFLIYTFVEPRLKIVVPRGSHQSNGTKVGTTPCIQYGKCITALGTAFGNRKNAVPGIFETGA